MATNLRLESMREEEEKLTGQLATVRANIKELQAREDQNNLRQRLEGSGTMTVIVFGGFNYVGVKSPDHSHWCVTGHVATSGCTPTSAVFNSSELATFIISKKSEVRSLRSTQPFWEPS